MPDNISSPEQPKPQQEGGTPMRPPLESGMQRSELHQPTATRRDVLGALVGAAGILAFGRNEPAQAARITFPDVVLSREQQQALSLADILQKSLISKEDLIKNPVNIVSSAKQENINGEITSEYYLIEDRKSNSTRVFTRAKQADGTFAPTYLLGNVAMKDAKSIAVDAKGNVVVVGQKQDGSAGKAALEILYSNNSSAGFVDVALEYGQGVNGGDIEEVVAFNGAFLLRTLSGLQVLTINPQVEDIKQRAKFTAASVIIKDTNLQIGRVLAMAVPLSEIQSQSSIITFYATNTANAKNGVSRVTLDLSNGIGTAEQFLPEIGNVDQPSLYTDSVTGDAHMLATNRGTSSFFDLNLTTGKIDKVFDYFNLVNDKKNLPAGSVGAGEIQAPYRVGNKYIASFSYLRIADGTLHPAVISWDKDVDPETNPEMVQFYFPFENDKIDAGIVSGQIKTYDNGLKAYILNIAGVRTTSGLGEVVIPLLPDGSLDIPLMADGKTRDYSKLLYPDKNMQISDLYMTVRT